MNRLAFAVALLVPSIASAHPGHSHEGMSSHHHLFAGAAICAVALLAGYLAKTKLSVFSRTNKNPQENA